MSIRKSAAIVATVVLALLIGFQLLLAAGLPLGQAAWGGQHTVLPTHQRLGSLAAAGILGIAAWLMLARAGLGVRKVDSLAVRIATWVFAAYLSLNTLGNLMSASPMERMVMTPASLLLAVCFLIVARS